MEHYYYYYNAWCMYADGMTSKQEQLRVGVVIIEME